MGTVKLKVFDENLVDEKQRDLTQAYYVRLFLVCANESFVRQTFKITVCLKSPKELVHAQLCRWVDRDCGIPDLMVCSGCKRTANNPR